MSAETEPLFVTIFELRAVHRDLLMRQNDLASLDSMRDDVRMFVERARDSGRHLHGEEHRTFAQAVIDYWTAALYRDSKLEIRKATLAAFDPNAAPDLPRENCPYVGLQPFDETGSRFFFGRSQQLKEMVALLEKRRLLCVIGQSGTGKSSLVRAGLIPLLRGGAIRGSDAWRYLKPIVPGANPLSAMARLLVKPNVVPPEPIDEHVKKLRKSDSYLRTKLEAEARPVFLVVDQFEELFTQCGSEADRNAFARNLASLTEAKNLQHRVILTVRSDYETQLVQLRALDQLVRDGEVRVSALNASELRDAIEGPAHLVGLTFDDGVVNAMVNETLGEPAALPLLQFALHTLWSMKDRNRIPMSAYQKLGGAVRALGREADRIFGALTPDQKMVAERVFSRIVRPAPGSETTSRRASMTELLRHQDPAQVREVVGLLVKARLLRITGGSNDDDMYVELMHEALSRNWNRLIQWTDRLRVQQLTKDRLEDVAKEWNLRGRTAALLDDEQLRDAEKWLKSPEALDLDPSPLLLEFVDASRASVMREKRRRQRAYSWFVAAMILFTISLTLMLFLAMERAAAARAEAARAIADTARAEAARKLKESETDYLRFLRKNDGDKVRELRERVVEPLEQQNAFLRVSAEMTAAEKEGFEAQLAEEKTRANSLATEKTRLDTELARVTKDLEDLRKQHTDLKEKYERLNDKPAETSNRSESPSVRPQQQPAAPAPQPAAVLPSSVQLRIGDGVGTSRTAPGTALISCFLTTSTANHYFITAGAALTGDPGEVVYARSGGETYRVGVIWKNIGERGSGATIVHLFDDVKYNPLPPDGRSFWGTEDDIDVGHNVQILVRDGTARGVVQIALSDKIVVAATGTPVLGAPVVNSSRELLGLVTAMNGNTVVITPIDAIIRKVYKASLDD